MKEILLEFAKWFAPALAIISTLTATVYLTGRLQKTVELLNSRLRSVEKRLADAEERQDGLDSAMHILVENLQGYEIKVKQLLFEIRKWEARKNEP